MTIQGKIVVITGAASGIGRALSVGFCRDGARTVGLDVNQEGLAETSQECGGQFLGVAGDTSSEADVDRLVATVMAGFGRIDVLFNNAGISDRGVLHECPFADWSRVIQVNLVGVALCTHRVLPIMLRQGYGRIINVVSRAAESRAAWNTAYAASKAGAVTFTKVLAGALVRDGHGGVLINAMIPGPTRTPIWGEALSEGFMREEVVSQMQGAEAVYPHARFLAELPEGGPTGRVFWNSQEYPIYQHFND